jgi:hypothetical protein
LIVDGRTWNTRQRSDNPAFVGRVTRAMQTAGRVEVVRSAAVPPAPPASSPLELAARNVVFVAEVDDGAIAGYLATGRRWSLAVTADHAYRTEELAKLIAAAKDQHRVIRPWCDCREPDGDPAGTPFRDALAMARELGLDEPIGECESSAEYDHAIAAGARILVGNPNALDPDRRRDAAARIGAGTLAIIGEMYVPDPNYSAGGVPIAGVCYGVAPGGGVHTAVVDYLAASTPAQRETFSVYHAAGLTAGDWRLLT